MRTTLALDDDVLSAAHQRAQREGISIGEAISRYIREALRSQETPPAPLALRSKYAVLPEHDEVITTERVRRLMDQEGV